MMVRWVRDRTAGVLAALALLGAAGPAAAQSAFEEPRLESVRDRLEAAASTARTEGLPVELLEAKVREGLAKRVPPPRIAAAVDTLLEDLRTADRLVSRVSGVDGADRKALVRGATEALTAGADARAVDRLIASIARSDAPQTTPLIQEALVVTAELAERGVDGRLAADSTRIAFDAQGRNGFRNLLRTVRSLGQVTPAERARAVRRAARSPRGSPPGLEGHPQGGSKGPSKGKGR